MTAKVTLLILREFNENQTKKLYFEAIVAKTSRASLLLETLTFFRRFT